MRLPMIVVNRLLLPLAARVSNSRPADFVIGGNENPYMRRWWVIPRNKWFNIYLHNVLRSDDPRALHDHPFGNLSILIAGSYTEVTHAIFDLDGSPVISLGVNRKVMTAGAFKFRRAATSHRLEIDNGPCWTFFITGPRVREWGFDCPKGWKHWKAFAAKDETGASIVGAGCGETE